MYINFIAILLLTLFTTHHANAQIIYSKDYIRVEDKDAVPGVLSLLKAAKEQGAKKIIFDEGIYHFYDDTAFEKWCDISNHDSGMKRIAFPMLNFNGIEIDGGGAKFIMHGMIIPFAIENSSNITLRNFSIDWFRPLHSELKVIATDSTNRSILFEIADEYPYEIRNGELIFLKKNFKHNLENAIYWDPNTNAVAFEARLYNLNKNIDVSLVNNKDKADLLYDIDKHDAIYRYRGKINALFASQLKPGMIRLLNIKAKLPHVGWILTAKGRNGFNRMAPAISLYTSINTIIENVTVHHASGMGLIAQNCTNVSLTKFNVLPDPNGNRVLSTTADATHFVGCRGKIVMDSCKFTNQLDDATNIHGTYVEVTDFYANKVGIKIGHFQQSGFDFAKAGDSIHIINPKSSAIPIGKLTLKDIEKINGRYYRLNFNEPTTAKLKVGYYLENVSAYPEAYISNCTFINNRARGLLLSTPKKVVIKNNTFSNMMSAIHCPREFTFWYESGYFKDLTIINNIFLDGSYGYGPIPQPIINVRVHSNEGGNYVYGKLRIENNVFTTYASPILFANFVKNLKFKNNTIKYSGTYPLANMFPVVDVQETSKAEIVNNKYDSRFNVFISDGTMNRDTKITGNQKIAIKDIALGENQ